MRLGLVGWIGLVSLLLLLLYLGNDALQRYGWRERARRMREACMQNLRELSQATAMYAQDHGGRYPGRDWVADVQPYLSSKHVFWCPELSSGVPEFPVTYGYNSLLLRADGTGCRVKAVRTPDQVGLLVDLEHYTDYRGKDDSPLVRAGVPTPVFATYHNGTTASYCDGHVVCIPKSRGIAVRADPSHPLNTAFFRAKELGYIAGKP